MEREVKIYTLPTCPFCVMAKEWLREKGVDFAEVDVQDGSKAREEMFDASGRNGVPVIKVDDKTVIGFNQTQLELLLNEN